MFTVFGGWAHKQHHELNHKHLSGDLHWELIQRVTPGFKLNPTESKDMESFRCTGLLAYSWLTQDAQSKGLKHYCMRPKYHRLDHCLRRAARTQLSPRCFWCFGSEDFLGHLARVLKVVHPKGILQRGVDRWLLYFWGEVREYGEPQSPLAVPPPAVAPAVAPPTIAVS